MVLSRRTALGTGMALGLGALVGGCASGPTFPEAHPGAAKQIVRLPGKTMRIAYTVDDGKDAATLQAYVGLANSTAVPITFCPTHVYATNWESLKGGFRALIGAGKVQVANHTWTHRDLTTLSDAEIRDEVSRTESWIQQTFGVTSRPYLRPPYGRWDRRVGAICGELGFTSVLLWDASLDDAAPVSSERVRTNLRKALYPGAIVLGHANAPAITYHFDELVSLIRERGLQPVTLDAALGTSREVG